MLVRIRHPEKLIYPESDGQPMGENTLQFQWIMTLFHGFENLYFHDQNVFVASDLFWYPVEGDPTTVLAPDLMIVLGQAKGHRGSYKQWEEGNLAPQAVFEIQSPSNRPKSNTSKRKFYSQFGVEEFYQYDPDTLEFQVWLRTDRRLKAVDETQSFSSPLLGVRFDMADEGLRVIRPDGRAFLTYTEMITEAMVQQERSAKLAAKLRELGVDPDQI